MQQAQAMTFTVTAPLMSAGINTGLGCLSQKPNEPNRKNQRAIKAAIPSYAETQDNTAFLHFIVACTTNVHSNIQQQKQVGKIPETNGNGPAGERYRT